MLEKEPLVSVVTPFYNTDEYLAECIESVLAQTYQNWEYILVNNCSTDRSAEIAQSYVGKDQRIRLIHNKNFLTQVQNYNHALRQICSESKYCKIVQADDWIFPECIAKMVEVAEANPSVGIVGSYSIAGEKVWNCGLSYKKDFFRGHEVCKKALLDNQHYFGSPTSIMLRSRIIRLRDPFYIENHPYEDTDLCYDVLQEWDFGFVHQILSYIRTQNNSILFNAHAFDPHYLDKFLTISKYGRIYLDSQEFNNKYSKVKDIYFTFLAENFVSRKGKDFWEYHQKSLANINYKFHKYMLIKYIVWELLDVCFNLKKTAGRLYRKIKRTYSMNLDSS